MLKGFGVECGQWWRALEVTLSGKSPQNLGLGPIAQ